MWAVGALVGFILGVFSARLLSSEARRSDAWRSWIELNSAVRTGDIYARNDALGLCEQTFRIANVPRPIFEYLASTSEWYVRWFSIYPPTSGVYAPDVLHDMHQIVINELNRHLSRKWWHPPLRSRPSIQNISFAMTRDQDVIESIVQLEEDKFEQRQVSNYDQPESGH